MILIKKILKILFLLFLLNQLLIELTIDNLKEYFKN